MAIYRCAVPQGPYVPDVHPTLLHESATQTDIAAMQAHIYLCDDAPKGAAKKKGGPSFREERSAMMGLGGGDAQKSLRDLARGGSSSLLHHKVIAARLYCTIKQIPDSCPIETGRASIHCCCSHSAHDHVILEPLEVKTMHCQLWGQTKHSMVAIISACYNTCTQCPCNFGLEVKAEMSIAESLGQSATAGSLHRNIHLLGAGCCYAACTRYRG